MYSQARARKQLIFPLVDSLSLAGLFMSEAVLFPEPQETRKLFESLTEVALIIWMVENLCKMGPPPLPLQVELKHFLGQG
jgi:hypothetical protein